MARPSVQILVPTRIPRRGAADVGAVAHCIRRFFFAALASIMLALGSGAPATADAAATEPCADTKLTATPDNLDRMRAATLCLVNAERAKHDLAPLQVNDRLTSAAEAYSAKMVRQRFFSHVCPEGSTLTSRLRSAKYVNKSVHDYVLGENIGWGSGSLGTPRSIVRAWMRSAPHRDAILDSRFRDVGVGIASGAPRKVRGRAATYTTEFGYRVTT
jgi:uncharacterized protein YkwD